MPYDQAPETPITTEQAVEAVQAFIDERATSRVLMGLFTIGGVVGV